MSVKPLGYNINIFGPIVICEKKETCTPRKRKTKILSQARRGGEYIYEPAFCPFFSFLPLGSK
jgi:hypothetical protein